MAVGSSRMVTPEAVALHFEPAGLGSRGFAVVIDWLVQGIALFAVLAGLGALTAATGGADRGLSVAAAYLLGFAIVFGYPVGMETLWGGRSLGKAALGLRVVTREGAPVRFRHAAIRAALGLVDFVLLSGAVAVICVLVSRDNQRLGDMVAGTLVLRERSGLGSAQAVTFDVPRGLEAYVATLDPSGLSADDYGAVRMFLLRAPSLPPPVRARLALELAVPVSQKMRTSPDNRLAPETFLWCVAAAQQRRAMTAQGASGSAYRRHEPLSVASSPVAPEPGRVEDSATAASEESGGFAPPG